MGSTQGAGAGYVSRDRVASTACHDACAATKGYDNMQYRSFEVLIRHMPCETAG